MTTAMKASLDYFTANFSPFQFRQVRILEFPAYARFAQSFANTIPYSEEHRLHRAIIADPEKIDMVTYVTAHEIGHQWWGHQVIGADQQGGTLLVESLAQYSALMVMEQMYGPEQIRKFLKFELDRYLRSRGGEVLEELPLVRVENQPYIHYQKGGLAMYLLKDQIGAEQVSTRRCAACWRSSRFKPAPYANSTRPDARLPRGRGPGARAADRRPVREDHAVRRQGDRREVAASRPDGSGTSRSRSTPASCTPTARARRPRRRSTSRSTWACSRWSPAARATTRAA